MDTDALTRVGRGARRPRAAASGRSSPRSAPSLVVVGLVTYPAVFIFGIIAAARRRPSSGWSQAWSERASADAEYNADGPRPHRPPAGAADARRHRRRHHDLLVQPDHAGAVEDERTGAVRVIGALVLLVGFIVAFRPSLAHRRRRRRLRRSRRSASSPAAPARRSAASARSHPHETTGDARRRRRVRRRRRDRGRRATPRRTSPPRPTSRPSSRCRGRHADAKTLGVRGEQDDARRHPGQPDQRACSTTTATSRAGSCSTSAPARVDEATATRSPTRRCPTSSCTQLVEDGGSQLLTFSITTPSCGRRARRTRSSCPASTAPVEVVVP